MSSEQVDNLDRGESNVLQTLKDLLSGVGGLGHEVVGRGTRDVGAASQKLETRTANAVRDADGTGELDAVTG